jgi:sRNA-binding carbon storage regulator CsrA
LATEYTNEITEDFLELQRKSNRLPFHAARQSIQIHRREIAHQNILQNNFKNVSFFPEAKQVR